MRVLIVGAGAVGAYFGGRLALAAHDVVFTARGANLEALRGGGLRVSGTGGDFSLPPLDARADARGAGPFDLVIVCVKFQDTGAAVAGLERELAPGATVLSLQNGVESEELLERLLGLSPLLLGLAHIGAELVAPGEVRHTSGGSVVVGERDDRPSPRLEALVGVLRGAAIDVLVPENMRRAKWQKLAWNAAFNTIAALSSTNVGGILASPAGRGLAEAAMAEVQAVAGAEGVEFEPDHITRVLRYAERHLTAVRPSTLQDRERGKPLEHGALTGAVVRFGARHGIATPVCHTLDDLAALLSGDGRAG